MLTAAQVRMARAALEWRQATLAARSQVCVATITHIERGGTAYSDTLQRIKAVFEEEGLRFSMDGSVTPPVG